MCKTIPSNNALPKECNLFYGKRVKSTTVDPLSNTAVQSFFASVSTFGMPPKHVRSNPTEKNDDECEANKAILRFGAQVYDTYRKTPLASQSDGLQLSRFGDYLHHFGFSLELETALRGSGNRGGITAMASSKRPNPQTDLATTSETQALPPIDMAEVDAYSVRIASEMREKLPTTDLALLSASVCAPYETLSWRQTEEQCELKKVRCLYQWLCRYLVIRLTKPDDFPADGEKTAQAGAKPADNVASASTKPTPGDTRSRPKSDLKKNKFQKSVIVEEHAPPPDAIEMALRTCVATPRTAALMYQRMLEAVNVRCAVVTGWLKGYAPAEAFEWAWNRVQLRGGEYLVDIAASVYCGALRSAGSSLSPVISPSKPQEQSESPMNRDLSRSPGGTKRQPQKKALSPSSAPLQALRTEPELPNLSLSRTPRFLSSKRAVEEFYFFTRPEHFIHTHFPQNPEDSLLRQAPRRVTWDASLRLSESFFHYDGIALRSHGHRSVLSFSVSPFYISLLNKTPSTTELCCVLYPGTLRELPEDLNAAQPLGPQWVWNQRQESTCEETFTLMVPQSGIYCVVLGARPIRTDPYAGIPISTEDFTPLVRYQAKVKFISSSIPLLPRQHLSPAICRLLSPLSQQLREGVHRFVVMPTCSNIAAVAVVVGSRTGNNGGLGQGNRKVHEFLRFLPDRATYEGEVRLQVGHLVELWVLYTGPDRNGQTFEERLMLTKSGLDEAASVEQDVAASRPRGRKPSFVKRRSFRKDPAVFRAGREVEETRSLAQALSEGQVFIPMVTNIEVRLLLSKDVDLVIQPQPSVGAEAAPTLRRLMGITSDLYQEAMNQQQCLSQMRGVGCYFKGRATAA